MRRRGNDSRDDLAASPPLLMCPMIKLKILHSADNKSRGNVDVFLFKTVRELRRAAKDISKKGGWNKCAGAYIGLEKGKQFGVILLWDKLIGAGYFAHELQHFIVDYTYRNKLMDQLAKENTENKLSRTSEIIAWMCGEMTCQFWTEYYKLHPELAK